MMELYLDLYSQPCRSVFLFAKLAGIPFEFKHVDLIAGKSGLLSTEDRRLEIWLHTWLICACLWAFSSASSYNKWNQAYADSCLDSSFIVLDLFKTNFSF